MAVFPRTRKRNLTHEESVEIRQRAEAGENHKRLAAEYEVSPASISRIRNDPKFSADPVIRPKQIIQDRLMRRDIFFYVCYCAKSIQSAATFYEQDGASVHDTIQDCVNELIRGGYIEDRDENRNLGFLRDKATYLQASLEKIDNVYPEYRNV